MKIALVIEHFDAARGGAEHFAVWLAGQLVTRGHDVHVVCHDSRRHRDRYQAAHRGASHDAVKSATAGGIRTESVPGVTIHALRAAKLSTGFGFRQFGRRVSQWCRQHRPDLVHSISVAFPGDVYHPQPGVYMRMQDQAISSRDHSAAANFKRLTLGISGKQRTLLSLEKAACKPVKRGGADKIICISDLVMRDFMKFYQVPAERLVRMENPLMYRVPSGEEMLRDRQWLRGMYHLPDSARVALFAGHDFRRKGLSWAIRAVAASDDWHLVVVGMGKVRRYLELAEELRISPRVKFIGPTREMSRVYAGVDALLFPTFYDSFGLVALEAMAHGLEVISTRFLGAANLVEELGMGVIVDSPRCVHEMTTALDSIRPTWERRLKMVQAAEAHFARLRPQGYMDRLERIYRETVTPRSRHAVERR